MSERSPTYWREGIDAEDMLCVCVSCGAELNADCIGETCPVCGIPAEDAFPLPDEVQE